MNKLLKSVRASTNKRDDIIKQSITTNLSNSVKEIQYAGIEENKGNKVIDVTEAANTFCTTIEAMFLHGLKDSLSLRFKKALADVDERPDPNFWSPLLVISHRQIIDQIMNLSQITTEVGQCRAWVRLALNDCLLSSYLMTVRRDSSALKSFYSTNAYIRDGDLLDVAQRLIEGVEAFKTFTLPSNSSLLNTWPLHSLILAGIWAPTLKNCPVAPCDDVAMIIDESSRHNHDESSETASLCSAISYGSQASGLKSVVELSEDEVLKIILAKDRDEQGSSSGIPYSSSFSDSDMESNKPNVEDSINHNLGNSLNRTGWSFDESREEEQRVLDKIKEHEEPTIKEPKSMEASFTALIDSYNILSGGYIRTPDIREVWQRFEDERMEGTSPPLSTGDPKVIRAVPSLSPTKSESMSLSVQLGKIATERGLDEQNFECAGCKLSLSVTQTPNVCYYTGEYYCKACMSDEEVSIPAKIIHNWDFKPYPVSRKSFNYINEIKDHPVIDFKVLNPYVYGAIEEMAQLQTLRNQLNFLRAYLYTCKKPIIEQLQKQMWPREYMYEHIHQYSISDLNEIQNLVLAQQLEKVVQFGKDHVMSCWLCSQKGFVCEVCTKPKPLFPFDVEHVYRCEECNAVFHKNCLNSSKPCPKCKRRKEREELPLLGAIMVE